MAKTIMLFCLAMALISALIYILMANGVMLPTDLTTDQSLPPYFYIVPAGYVIGGFLILIKKRWLWITGAVINGFGVIMFYTTYADQVGIMLSAAGLITKIAQILMEIGLVYLIVKYKRKRLESMSNLST